MPNIDYAWEKFHATVLTLAGPGALQDRLVDAYSSQLVRLKRDDLPRELQADFSEIEKALTSGTPTGDEGTIAAAVRAMSEQRRQEIAEKIVSMYDAVAHKHGKASG
jgi:hypothetical protein